MSICSSTDFRSMRLAWQHERFQSMKWTSLVVFQWRRGIQSVDNDTRQLYPRKVLRKWISHWRLRACSSFRFVVSFLSYPTDPSIDRSAHMTWRENSKNQRKQYFSSSIFFSVCTRLRAGSLADRFLLSHKLQLTDGCHGSAFLLFFFYYPTQKKQAVNNSF